MPVTEDSDQVLPLLNVGDAVETPEGSGVLVDVQFQTAQYNGKWELEPPSLVVELDSGETVHTCLCVITLPHTVKGTALLHQEFNRLWPPQTDGVPEGADMLIPEGDEDSAPREGTEKEAMMRAYTADFADYADDPDTQRALMELFEAENLDPVDFDAEDGQVGVDVRPLSGYEPEFVVVTSYTDAIDAAVEYVTDQLHEEPELFTQSWLMYYIDEDRLRDALSTDEFNSIYDDMVDEIERNVWDAAERMDVELEDFEDEEGELDEEALKTALEERLDSFVENEVNARLEDPVEYLKDMLGDEEGVKMAMKWGGIDIDRAARDAVDSDGPGHFLATYDGNIEELPGGGVYWRTN